MKPQQPSIAETAGYGANSDSDCLKDERLLHA